MEKRKRSDGGGDEGAKYKNARQNDEAALSNELEVDRVLRQTILDILRSRKRPGSTC